MFTEKNTESIYLFRYSGPPGGSVRPGPHIGGVSSFMGDCSSISFRLGTFRSWSFRFCVILSKVLETMDIISGKSYNVELVTFSCSSPHQMFRKEKRHGCNTGFNISSRMSFHSADIGKRYAQVTYNAKFSRILWY